MTANSAEKEPSAAGLGIFEKWLSVWVGLSILAGLALGNIVPGPFAKIAEIEYASVNLIMAVLIWAMIYPMMISVDFGSLKSIGSRPKGIFLTLIVNWLVKPFSMAALAVLFFEFVFAPFIPADDAEQYIAGLILLGAAPLHRNGVCLVADDEGRPCLHARAGVIERCHHDLCLCTDRGAFAGCHEH